MTDFIFLGSKITVSSDCSHEIKRHLLLGRKVMTNIHNVLKSRVITLRLIFPSIRIFSSESALHIRWPKYWSFNFSNSLFNKYSGLISFMIGWFDLLIVQGNLKSLLQHHGLKASILWCSACFMSNFHIRTWLLEKPSFWFFGPLPAKWCLFF